MLSRITSLGCQGVGGFGVTVECSSSNGLPRFEQYDRYRGETMAKTIYAQEAVEDPILDCVCFQKMIPQLLKFNFIETPDTLLYY